LRTDGVADACGGASDECVGIGQCCGHEVLPDLG
jgi:hypothetical protein